MGDDPKLRGMLERQLDRRRFLVGSARTAASAAIAAFLAACGLGGTSASPSASGSGGGAPTGRAIKIGFVSPETGNLAPFAEGNEYIFDGIRGVIGSGIQVGDTIHPIEIITKDSQSDPARAGEVANELILDDEVDLVLVPSTPETANPVADVCEANGKPCISTVVPWQSYFVSRQADPTNPDSWQPFEWTYHFFWGLEDVIGVFTAMWDEVETNKKVGGIFPNDGDGNAWGANFPGALEAAGYTLIDPGRYENGNDNFSDQIRRFVDEGVEIVTGVPIPPDFTTFWTQAAEQEFRPKVASIGKAMLFPSSAEALGELAENVSTEIWWTPSHPFSSSLTGESAQELADGYTAASERQWTQPLGFAHALLEVALDVLKRTEDVDSPEAIRDAIVATNLDTVVGHVEWTGDPNPNVSKTPLVGGQWRTGTDFPNELVVVTNSLAPEIPTSGEMQPIGG